MDLTVLHLPLPWAVNLVVFTSQGAGSCMEYLERLLDVLKDLAKKLIDLVLEPEVEPELEPIPIPVRDRSYR
jgi:hypothetical protein